MSNLMTIPIHKLPIGIAWRNWTF